ncbi:hypothetical protein F4806DRAFT_407599 [Annulohypoxylon nitens]|nr:hypothetical protein F4806DRAFT_407599 [Annulohypoxylon nitens]
MYSTRLMNLLMVALSVSSVTGVAWLDDRQTGVGHHEVKRADNPLSIATAAADPTGTDDAASASATDDSSSSTSASADSSTTSPSSTSQASSTSTTTDNTTPTSTQTTPTSTNNSPTTNTNTATSTTNRPSSSSSTPTGTTTNGGGDGTTSTTPTTTAAPSTSTFVTIITTTDSAGQTVTTSSSSTVVSTPTAAADSSNNNNSTMSPETKRTIIGVCVGVGGAIVLAAAGVLFWRLRSKRRSHEENEELVSYGDGFGGPGTAEKTEPSGSTATRSPFQSTLESYHAPTQTNAASNF